MGGREGCEVTMRGLGGRVGVGKSCLRGRGVVWPKLEQSWSKLLDESCPSLEPRRRPPLPRRDDAPKLPFAIAVLVSCCPAQVLSQAPPCRPA